MAFDSSTTCSDAPAVPRESGKKKRTNRAAKLKQCKLEARREQWLSQVKTKNSNVANDHVSSSSLQSSSMSHGIDQRDNLQDVDLKQRHKIGKCEEHEIINESDLESPANSPTRPSSSTTISSKDSIGDGLSWPCSSSSSYSRSFSEADDEEEDLDGEEAVLDDWEAVADALTIKTPNQESTTGNRSLKSELQQQMQCDSSADECLKKMEPIRPVPMAWRPDDMFRPSSLPSLAKCHSFPTNMERRSLQGKSGWVNVLAITPPSSCPICYEDLDLTDSSFLPCPCGFHICLFCHKRIQEADGRCPGCRKSYTVAVGPETTSTLARQLTHSCSMTSRS